MENKIKNNIKSGIYCITNTVNGKVYVGSAINIPQRWKSHKSTLYRKVHDNIVLQRAWDKYGESAFIFSVVERVLDKNDLIDREQYWIVTLKAYGKNGYNLCPTAGNCLGRKFSDETKAKMSISAKKKPPISEETRAKLSATQKAVSPEVRARIAAKHIGKKHTPESIEKMRASQKGKSPTKETRGKIAASISALMTPEHREEIAATLRGRKNGSPSKETVAKISATKMGHTVSAETRAKISSTLKRRAEERAAA